MNRLPYHILDKIGRLLGAEGSIKVALMVDNDVLAPLIPHTRRYSVKLSVINKFKIQIVWNETEKMSICLEVGEENEYLQDENFVISRQTLGLGFTHLVTSLLHNHDLEHAYFRSMTADRMEYVQICELNRISVSFTM
ncbi:hypothetical protein CAEBREN_20198 [Caenorhabditis brenneri]|uniref:Uncharacterized protein n=1 Tax=Caenorhabditis brenneri TaxID=135651 RepID=G0PBW5_CAEBE|nr:hypothetical protein CAEBREN_20198 [Caenorhabditis brenneri]